MFIMAGMPGGRHLAVLSLSEEPAIRDLLIACHFARYSGVNSGAVGLRPCEPSDSGAVRVGGGSGCPGAGAGAPPARAPPLPPPAAPNALMGRYTPEKSGGVAADCAPRAIGNAAAAATMDATAD